MSIARHRTWLGSGLMLTHIVDGLTEASGKQALESVRAEARSCQSYVETPDKPARVMKADVPITELPDDDVYA